MIKTFKIYAWIALILVIISSIVQLGILLYGLIVAFPFFLLGGVGSLKAIITNYYFYSTLGQLAITIPIAYLAYKKLKESD